MKEIFQTMFFGSAGLLLTGWLVVLVCTKVAAFLSRHKPKQEYGKECITADLAWKACQRNDRDIKLLCNHIGVTINSEARVEPKQSKS